MVKPVVDHRVHGVHGIGRDAGVGVDMLQDLVDVDLERLFRLLRLLARLAATLGTSSGGGFLSGHFYSFSSLVICSGRRLNIYTSENKQSVQ